MRISDWSSDVCSSDLVDREDATGGAVLGRHVADRSAIGQRQVLQALAVELDELADHAVLAQHLGDGEHQVGGGGAFGQLAGELEADDLRDQHRRRLAQHGGFGLDAAHAPAEHADAVDHRGMRSEEHTSELQSLMRISYAVFCLKKKTIKETQQFGRHMNTPKTNTYTEHTRILNE